ncbi:MAG: L-threonylcarbamoyladenylate synthase [Planctomycetota bacterium]
MKTRVVKPGTPAEIALAAEQGAQVLRRGGLVGFPTETVYGVAAAAEMYEGLERLRELKDRPERPFGVHLPGPEAVGRYVKAMPLVAQRLIRRAWPGPVTLVLPTGGRLAEEALQNAGLCETLCYEGTIGLRCPDEPSASAMLGKMAGPVVAASANLKGMPSPREGWEVLAALDGRIDLLIDTGPTRWRKDSTIVQVDASGWKMLREGAYDEAAVRAMAGVRILFVCTGNTCRSPMAAGLAAAMTAGGGVTVESAGLDAWPGEPAADNAVRAVAELGGNIAGHTSQIVTSQLIRGADMIFCMTAGHAAQLRRMEPEGPDRVKLLDDQRDIPDPFGGSLEEYRVAAGQIKAALERRAKEGWT